MSISEPEKLKMKSVDLTVEKVEKIAELFPGVVTEIADGDGNVRKGIDFDLLRQELSGDYVEGREERYDFTWVGKRRAIVEANQPIQKTLRPCIEESKDWENTENVYIEGDNLDALKLLQESYLNKVKMIYIDPPYNTGNDFIYNDNFVMDRDEYDEESGAVDESGNRMIKNGKDRGRYHSDWCSMLYPRLKLARNLLRDDGVIFVSIDDNEVHNLRKMMDEIFGEENFVANVVWQKKYAATNDVKGFSTMHDYVLIYQKSELFNRNLLPRTEEQNKPYYHDDGDGKGLWRSDNILVKSFSSSCVFPILNPNTGREHYPPEGSCWRANKETIKTWLSEKRIFFGKDGTGAPQLKRYLNEVQQGRVPTTWWPFSEVGHNDAANKELKHLFNSKAPFDTPKPSTLIKQMLLISTSSSDTILDFFAGSSTTAHAVMQLNAEDGGNRKFIMVQLPEACDERSEAYKAGYKNISEIGKERIRRAGEQIKNEIEEENRQAKLGEEPKSTPDIGFRAFKVDDTNMKDVYYSAAEYSQEMIGGLVDNVKGGRTDLDLLYQVLINWGLPLDLKHEIEEIDGFTIHTVDTDTLVACFEPNIPESVMRKIAGKKPLRTVFRDGSFKNSPGKLNIEGIFKTIAPDTKVRVI